MLSILKRLRILSYYFSTAAVITLYTSACTDNKFKISGEISGATDSLFVLQRPDFNGRWVTVDSVRANNSGKFKFTFDAPASPEVFRVALGSKYVYIPVDSTETFSISGKLSDFPSGINVSGSDAAVLLSRFEREADAMSGKPVDSLENFKRRVYAEYIKDGKASVTSFHVLGKMIDGRPLFNPNNPQDAKYYSAVATAFVEYRPNDPRTESLKQTALKAQQARNRSLGRQKVIKAPTTSIINISLPDVNGRNKELSELTSNGRPTIVVFSNMTDSNSPAINRSIADIYNRGKVNVYQVCLDADRNAWREAAKAIPWVCVYDPSGRSSLAAAQYNVAALPAVYVYNSKGELVSQASSFEDLDKKLANL